MGCVGLLGDYLWPLKRVNLWCVVLGACSLLGCRVECTGHVKGRNEAFGGALYLGLCTSLVGGAGTLGGGDKEMGEVRL